MKIVSVITDLGVIARILSLQQECLRHLQSEGLKAQDPFEPRGA